jgi:hypothetical protein
VIVFIHPCGLLTPTGMSYLNTEKKNLLVTQLPLQVCRLSELLRSDKLRNTYLCLTNLKRQLAGQMMPNKPASSDVQICYGKRTNNVI